MFNVEEFNSYIKDKYNKNIIFIHNDKIQAVVNNSPVCNCENIEKIIIKIMSNEFYVDILSSHYPDYEQSYILFSNTFRKTNYSNFNYFYCTLSVTNTRVVVIFPLKYQKEFYKKLCKINNLKVFL